MGGADDDDDQTRVTDFVAPLQPGSVLAGRYVLERRIGEGGMGQVFAAVDAKLEERVAIKLLRGPEQHDPASRERFHREVRLAHRVTHRNVARTFDIGEADGRAFLTMELVEGESLAAVMRHEQPMAVPKVIAIALEICEGLAAAHEAGVIHRDLKPANILVERSSGRVVLTDFGIAREFLDAGAITADGGEIVGTPVYMAPEQVRGDVLGVGTDLFALGVILYEMTTGRRPFTGRDAKQVAEARLWDPPEPPGRHASLPTPLEALIMRCLERDPSSRPEGARAVATVLQGLKEGEEGGRTVRSGALDTVESHGSTQTGFVSTKLGEQAVAVLPLRYRGPADEAYLAEALTEQLVDLLAMTKGLEVPGSGAVRRCGEDRDPLTIHEALGVDAVIDGTMQRAGSRIRVTVRLVDGRTGRQTWSEQLDGELQDVFELQDRIATQVAETLRLQLETRGHAYRVPPEAVESYLRARVKMGEFLLGGPGPEGAVALLERCLSLAPRFPPALATFALACSRMEFFHGAFEGDRDWPALCKAAVAEALEHASDLPDTHLACARMHAQRGEYPEAAHALQRALNLAPTHAAARAYLGVLQCEAGRSDEGLRHIDLAFELDPSMHWPLLTKLRHLGLRGTAEARDELIALVETEAPDLDFGLTMVRLRIALWTGDTTSLRCAQERLGHKAVQSVRAEFGRDLVGFVLGEIERDAFDVVRDRALQLGTSRRYHALVEQEMIEALLARGEHDAALSALAALADGPFVDVEWLEHCPLLGPLRTDPVVRTSTYKVRARAQAIWTVR